MRYSVKFMKRFYSLFRSHVVIGCAISGNAVSKDRIDASVGLSFSLKLLQRYRSNGVLQAKLHHVPGIRGQCMAYIYLSQGTVVTCYAEDLHGQRQQMAIDIFIRVDNERGPFEWTFQTQNAAQANPSPASEAQSTNSAPARAELSDSLTPVVVAPLPWDRLGNWTLEQKQMLYNVWRAVDGRHTVQEIKASVGLPPQVVEELLKILLSFHIINADISL
jgi:hypothetical protein